MSELVCKMICDEPRFHAGLCERHYAEKVGQRFWPLVLGRDNPVGCWEWTGASTAAGYGVAHFGGPTPTSGAHRVAYRLARGHFPEGLTLDHLCRNKLCVNPMHLEPVSSWENIRRAWTAQAPQKAAPSPEPAKRQYGTGSIVHRGGNRWQVRWYETPDVVTGERRRRSKTVTGTKRDALRQLAEVSRDAFSTDGASVTLANVIRMWRAQAGHELGTARNYDLAERTLPDHLLTIPVTSIRAATLVELYRRIELEHGVHRTRLVHALMSGALTHAWRMEWIGTNPARRVRPPSQPRRLSTGPETSDIARLLEVVADDPQLFAWLLVSAATGARRGEVLALRWSHVNLDAGAIVIDGALDPVAGTVKDTKTAGGRRVIAVGPVVVDALRRWRTAVAGRALASVGSLVADPFVFTESLDGGRPWRPDSGTKRFARIRARSKIPATVRLHDLRHHAASVLLASGVEAKTVASRLGHTRVSTTTDLYGHVMPARDQVAADVLDRALGGT